MFKKNQYKYKIRIIHILDKTMSKNDQQNTGILLWDEFKNFLKNSDIKLVNFLLFSSVKLNIRIHNLFKIDINLT